VAEITQHVYFISLVDSKNHVKWEEWRRKELGNSLSNNFYL